MGYKKEDDIRVNMKRLHPWLQYKFKKWQKLCHKHGYYIAVTEGYRTIKQQNDLYAQGRTKPGNRVTNARGTPYQSQHQWGIAIDFGCPATSTKEFYNSDRMKKMAKLAKEVGFGWGGDWTNPVDVPHLYLPKWGATTTKLKLRFRNPLNFEKKWYRKLKKKSRIYATKSLDKTKVKKQIKKDTEVAVLWYKGKYAKVKMGNTVGYVYRTRLKKVK